MNATATKTWTLEFRSDLYPVTNPEDGSVREYEALYLVAIDGHGNRFAHDHTFLSHRLGHGEAVAAVRKLLVKVNLSQKYGRWAGPRDNSHWREIEPVYGSEAYQGRARELGFEQDLREAQAEGAEAEFLTQAARAGRIY